MKLTVIGNYGPYTTKQNTATSCYLLEQNSTRLILDFGSGAMSNISCKGGINNGDYIFISHLHFDHTSDLLTLRYYLELNNKKVNIITEKNDSEYYKILFDNSVFNVINVDRNSTLKIGDFTLTFFDTVHPAKNLAVRVKGDKTFIYTGDTTYYDGIENDLQNADVVLVDALKPDSFNGPHMRSSEAVKLQEKLGGIYLLTHEDNYRPVIENENVIVVDNLAEYEF